MPRKPSTKTLQKKAYSKFLKVAKKKPSVPVSVKSYVKKSISRNIETKMASDQFTITGFNSSITAQSDCIKVLPTVAQGQGQNSRIGSQIKPVKLVIKGYVIYNADALSNARMIGARLFCYSDRSISNYQVGINSGNNLQLLELGGVPVQYTGTTMNYLSPHNSSLFKFYADKRMKILKPYGLTNALTPSASNEITGMSSSMFHPFTITIPASKMPSTLRFDETLSGNPTNFAPYISVGYSDLLGFTADTTVTQIELCFCSTLYYKDA